VCWPLIASARICSARRPLRQPAVRCRRLPLRPGRGACWRRLRAGRASAADVRAAATASAGEGAAARDATRCDTLVVDAMTANARRGLLLCCRAGARGALVQSCGRAQTRHSVAPESTRRLREIGAAFLLIPHHASDAADAQPARGRRAYKPTARSGRFRFARALAARRTRV
jgi:hypothetical protein